ncbi:hypothetical protein [Roseococcus pinisoli]|uniref:Uncharacterized protein n=1 Tax=Roseococcus pinisoli TaxID=2835040 RepID=A0ABS5Q9C9_9PROT|nr:hypothetical protein [Roseococcus pinisoli]MBS7809801.1 hypothetical protein [Roseococcus pinisoli]
MDRRRLMFMGLAGAVTATLGLAGTAKAAILGDTSGISRSPVGGSEVEALPAVGEAGVDSVEDGIVLAQHYRGPRRRGPRCWNETRNVRYRDRHGRLRTRRVTQRVCR